MYKRLLLAALLTFAIAIAYVYRDHLHVDGLRTWVDAGGAAAIAAFIVLYTVATVLMIPGSVLTLLGGALFGPVFGTLYNLAGATLGATLAFVISRYIAGDWIARRTGGVSRRLLDGVASEGWRFVALTRLVPLIPFNLLNYLLGLTRIPLRQYVFTSALCMVPGAAAYTYLGHLGNAAVSGDADFAQKLLLGLALVGALLFVPRLVIRLRRKPMMTVQTLSNRLADGDELLLLDVRSADEFCGEQGHVSGSRNIPIDQLESHLDEFNGYLERPIAIICKTDRRSAKAGRLLLKNGFNDVHVVENGMTAWCEAGLPVER